MDTQILPLRLIHETAMQKEAKRLRDADRARALAGTGAELEEDGWVILKFTSDQITDGEEQAILIRDTVKEQMRDMKKTKKKK